MVKEFFGTGESAVQPDKPMTEREVVVAVVKHPLEEAYLCVRNKKFNWLDFVMGGIEGEETPAEAEIADVLWVPAAELAEKLTQQAHQYIWEMLQKHDTIKR